MAPKASQAARRFAAKARATLPTDVHPREGWRRKNLAAASAEEAAWRQQRYWVLGDAAYELIAGKLRTGSLGEWAFMKACPHTAESGKCTCPKMLNVAHSSWGICRVVDGQARPVFKGSDMDITSLLPLGIAGMAREHWNAMLEALAVVDIAVLEESGRVCSAVEGMLRSTCAQARAAATAVFYHAPSGAHAPRISYAKRLEHAIEPEVEDFIVFWHHQYMQFGLIDGPDMESFFENEKRRF